MNNKSIYIKLPSTTTVVMWFIGICLAFFFFQVMTTLPEGIDMLTKKLGLIPIDVWKNFQIWRLVSYIFLHGSLIHLLLNLFVFWMFGGELERLWGSREFLKYILIGGIGAGLFQLIFSFKSDIPIIGASGVVFSLLLAYSMTFPEKKIYLYLVIPIKAKYLAILFGVLELLMIFSSSKGNIAHFAHLGGMLFGFIYLKFIKKNYKNNRDLKNNIKRYKNNINLHKIIPKKPNPILYDNETLKREVDRILLKININGKESLSGEELQVLHEASKRFGKYK